MMVQPMQDCSPMQDLYKACKRVHSVKAAGCATRAGGWVEQEAGECAELEEGNAAANNLYLKLPITNDSLL